MLQNFVTFNKWQYSHSESRGAGNGNNGNRLKININPAYYNTRSGYKRSKCFEKNRKQLKEI